MLSLLRGLKPGLTAGGHDADAIEDAIAIMFSTVVRAHCRRQDLTSALAEVSEMEAAGGEVGAEIFSCLLDACAIPRPPLLREVETVWSLVEVSATVPGRPASIFSLRGEVVSALHCAFRLQNGVLHAGCQGRLLLSECLASEGVANAWFLLMECVDTPELMR